MYEDNDFANAFLAAFEDFVANCGYEMSALMNDSEQYRVILERFWSNRVEGAKKAA